MKILAIGDFQGKFPIKLQKLIKKEKLDAIISVGDHGGIAEWYPWLKDMFKRTKKGKLPISTEEFFGKKRFKQIQKKDDIAAKKVFRTLNDLGKTVRVFYIIGNTDDDWYRYPFDRRWPVNKTKFNFLKNKKNLTSLDYRSRKWKNFTLIGFGGYMDIVSQAKDRWRTKQSRAWALKRISRSKKKLFEVLKKTKAPRIFVFHYPPKGIFDIIKEKDNPYKGRSTGIHAFAQAIKRYKPRLVLCGHMHEYQGMKKLHGVPVINPGDAGEGKAAIITLPENKKNTVKVKFIK